MNTRTRSRRMRTLSGIALSWAFLVSCQAGPPRTPGTSEFLEDWTRTHEDTEFPFERVWFDEERAWDGFREIYVAPIDTSRLDGRPGWQAASFGDESRGFDLDAAEYFRQSLAAAFRNDAPHRFRVVELPSSETLVLELALVDAAPTSAWLNSLGPEDEGGSDYGCVAMRAQTREGAQGPIIAQFVDRESSTHTREILDGWASEFVAIAKVRGGGFLADRR